MTVTSLEIQECTPFEGGIKFGNVGSYEQLEGIAHFEIDPLLGINSPIIDIELAPRNSEGKVMFSSDFVMLRPRDSSNGNRALLFDVVNRGNKTVFKNFNSNDPYALPMDQTKPGNGFLMRNGYTLVWCGWQPDVRDTLGLVRMRTVPEALGPDGLSIQGNLLLWFQVDETTDTLPLTHGDHYTHPPVSLEDSDATLFVSDHPNDVPSVIDRAMWSFLPEDSTTSAEWRVKLKSGFQPGRIYQLVYRSEGSIIVGVGFAAMRDIVSFLKHGSVRDGNPLAGTIDYAYAFGRSQSGRFLRQYLHMGLNEDELGRIAVDGVIAHVAGGMRGEFNLRFGQPSKDICFICPGLFPFTDTPQLDPVTGESGSILSDLEERGVLPKTVFVNTSSEYWRGDAALIHTDLENMSDAPEHESVRRYHFAGTQHGSGEFPALECRPSDGVRGLLPYNSIDYNPLLRSILDSLHQWVSMDTPPPPSKHPSLYKGTAVESSKLGSMFSEIPDVKFVSRPTTVMRLQHGDEIQLGRTAILPPDLGESYPALVSKLDQDCNEVAGIRLPDLEVPLGTHTGWNLRHPENGNTGLVMGISGGLSGWTLPFPVTKIQRQTTNDPRISIEERYVSRDEYLRLVNIAAEKLVQQRYLLEEDVPRIMEKSAERYNSLMSID